MNKTYNLHNPLFVVTQQMWSLAEEFIKSTYRKKRIVPVVLIPFVDEWGITWLGIQTYPSLKRYQKILAKLPDSLKNGHYRVCLNMVSLYTAIQRWESSNMAIELPIDKDANCPADRHEPIVVNGLYHIEQIQQDCWGPSPFDEQLNRRLWKEGEAKWIRENQKPEATT